MAERSHWWTERCLISLTLSISFSDYLPTYLPIYLSICLSIYLSLCLSIYLSLSLSISLSIYLSACCGILCASRHNGVHFFISHLASWLRTRRFSEPTFRPSGAPNHWKNTVFRDFPTFSRICIFFLLTFSTSQLPKVVRTPSVLYILTWKCASRHNGVHFFDISTSKSGPRPPVFNTFDFEMCFAPQRRALFQHLNFQKCSETVSFFYTFDFQMCFAPQRRTLFRHHNFQKWSDVGVLCAFWLGNVLRATTACNFSSLIWPHGSAPAALASLLFDPPEPQIIGKTQCFATSLPFRASVSSVFLLFLFWSSLF